MTLQTQRATRFRELHQSGAPLILVNAWDAGSARIVQQAGARAIATGSWSVAAALGMDDGEQLPLPMVLDNLARIVAVVEVPVSLDLERGYGATTSEVAASVEAAIKAGAIGFNLEDGLEGGLRSAEEQAERLAAARQAANACGVPAYLNARTDIFLTAMNPAGSEDLAAALARAQVYAEAGADGLFVPGLSDLDLVAELVRRSPLPINVMRAFDGPPVSALAACGVVRISHGPAPWRHAMAALSTAARALLG